MAEPRAARILRVLSSASIPMNPFDTLVPKPIHPFDARAIAKRFRHAAIFGAIDTLNPGETMRFVNDHDPLPLLAQLRQRYNDTLLIEYQVREEAGVMIDFTVTDGSGGARGAAVAAVAADAPSGAGGTP